jgi:hypothetical protein
MKINLRTGKGGGWGAATPQPRDKPRTSNRRPPAGRPATSREAEQIWNV